MDASQHHAAAFDALMAARLFGRQYVLDAVFPVGGVATRCAMTTCC